MIPFPFQIGQLGFEPAPSAGGGSTVTFRSAGTMVINGTGTTVAPAVPIDAAAGDLLVAAIMRRSAVASDPPAGWTLVSSVGPSIVQLSQWTHVYIKTATGSEAGGTETFSQATSGRICGQIICITGSSGTPTLESQDSAVGSVTMDFPVLTSAGDGRLGVAVGSITGVNTAPATNTLSANLSWVFRSTVTAADNRLGVCTKGLASGVTTAGAITSSAASGGTGTTTNALIFVAP